MCEPLIFKFIDWSKDQIGKYDYDFLGIIYYEYNTSENEWILHNSNYKKDVCDTVFPNIKLHKIFYGDSSDKQRPNHKKNFFIEHSTPLKKDENSNV